MAPYIRDSYKIIPNITLEFGTHWEYLSPFHEVKDPWTFYNRTLTNPLIGTPGLLQFAGNHGGEEGSRFYVPVIWMADMRG